MNKYIVKNCPALRWDRKTFKACYDKNGNFKCEDIEDCLIKQIVQRANDCLTPEVIELLEIENINEEKDS